MCTVRATRAAKLTLRMSSTVMHTMTRQLCSKILLASSYKIRYKRQDACRAAAQTLQLDAAEDEVGTVIAALKLQSDGAQ